MIVGRVLLILWLVVLDCAVESLDVVDRPFECLEDEEGDGVSSPLLALHSS